MDFEDLINSLTKLQKNSLLYASGHTALLTIQLSCDKFLNQILSEVDVVSILVFDNEMRANGRTIENHKGATALTQYFSAHGIISLSLERGVQSKSITRLFEMLNKLPTNAYLINYPNIKCEIDQLDAIKVSEIDLSKVQFAHKNINMPESTSKKIMLKTLMSKSVIESQQHDVMWLLDQMLESGHLNVDDVDITEEVIFSTFKMDDRNFIDAYKELLEHNFSENNSSTTFGSELFFSYISRALKNFDMNTEREIANYTLDYMNNFENMDTVHSLKYVMPNELMTKIFANQYIENKQLSPSLVNLLTGVHQSGNPIDNRIEFTEDKLDTLLDEENYDAYVDENYGRMLFNIANQNVLYDKCYAHIESQIDASLNEKKLTRTIIGALIATYKNEKFDIIDTERIEPLTTMVLDLLHQKDYKIVINIYRYALKDSYDNLRFSKSLLRFFRSNSLVDAVMDEYSKADIPSLDIVKMIMNDQQLYIRPLTQFFFVDPASEKRDITIKLLLHNPEDTIFTLVKMITYDKEIDKASAIELFELCKPHLSEDVYLKLLSSPDPNFRTDAVKTLASTKHPKSMEIINKLINSSNLSEFQEGLNIISSQNLDDFVDQLTSKINLNYIMRKDFEHAKRNVKALAQMDSPKAKKYIMRLKKTRFSLTYKRLAALKKIVGDK